MAYYWDASTWMEDEPMSRHQEVKGYVVMQIVEA